MILGDKRIHLLNSGSFGLDGGAMFGSVPKVLWDRKNPADKTNRIELALRLLLIESGDRRVLVDTGIGGKWSQKEIDMFRIDQPEDAVDVALRRAGFRCEDVTDVILTHLHFDHAGGATRLDGNEIVPTFPNATYYTHQRQWDLANGPSQKDRASFIPDNYVPLQHEGRLEILQEATEIIPGIETIVGNGHTDGHQMVKISGGGETMVFLGDTVPTTSHIRLPYIMGYDLRPLETLAEKERLLHAAAKEGWWLFFDHDPLVPGVKIVPGEKGYDIVEDYDGSDA